MKINIDKVTVVPLRKYSQLASLTRTPYAAAAQAHSAVSVSRGRAAALCAAISPLLPLRPKSPVLCALLLERGLGCRKLVSVAAVSSPPPPLSPIQGTSSRSEVPAHPAVGAGLIQSALSNVIMAQ